MRPAEEGTHLAAELELRRTDRSAAGVPAAVQLTVGTLEGSTYAQSVAELATGWRELGAARFDIDLRLAGGASVGSLPSQRIFLLGGTGTLPGYDYRSFAGRHFGLAQVDIAGDLVHPWLRLRGLAGVGWTHLEASEPGGADATGGWRPAAGAGVGLFYDIVRVHVVRGLRDGRWQAVLSVSPGLRDIL